MQAWFIWFIAGLFYLYEFIHRVAPSVMVPELIRDFQVSASQLGTLSACYYYAYAMMQIPVGLLLDRFGTRYLLSAAALLVSIGSFMFAQTETLWIAQLTRILIGIGSAFSFVGCLKLAAQWFPLKRFPLVIGLTNLLGICGALLGSAPLAQLLEQFTWRDLFYFSGSLGVLFTLLIYLFVHDAPKNQSLHPEPCTFDMIIAALKKPALWQIAICGGLMVLPIAAFSELWGVPYLMLKYEIARPQAAMLASSTFIGISCGGPLIGLLAGYIQQKQKIIAWGAFGAFGVTTILFYGPILPVTINFIGYFLFGFFSSSMLLCFTLNCEQIDPRLHATIIAFTNMLIMAGSVVSQPLIGWALDQSYTRYGLFQVENFQWAFILLPVCQLTASLILLRQNTIHNPVTPIAPNNNK